MESESYEEVCLSLGEGVGDGDRHAGAACDLIPKTACMRPYVAVKGVRDKGMEDERNTREV